MIRRTVFYYYAFALLLTQVRISTINADDRMIGVMNGQYSDATTIGTQYTSLGKQSGGWKCQCWNSTEGIEIDLECRCYGQKLEHVPAKLHQSVQRLTISDAGIRVLRKNSLQPYKDTLREVILSNLHSLQLIEPGTFRDLISLRTIYISYCPELIHLDGLFDSVKSPGFLSLRVMHTGLQTIPDVSPLHINQKIVHMIDLEGNKITDIPSNSIRIKAQQVILNYNMITAVHAFAFNQSEIETLSLKGNRLLTYLHEDAFSGIINIRELEVSDTSINALPWHGLSGLEVLRIRETPTLKVIPSVYNFKNLRAAWLTHSFHCCAFKFPARHDPLRHAKHEAHVAQQKSCRSTAVPTASLAENVSPREPSSNTDLNTDAKEQEKSFLWVRRKRWIEIPEGVFRIRHGQNKVMNKISTSTENVNVLIEEGVFSGTPIDPGTTHFDHQGFRADAPFSFGESHSDWTHNSERMTKLLKQKKLNIGPSTPFRGHQVEKIASKDSHNMHSGSHGNLEEMFGIFHQTTAVFKNTDTVLCGNLTMLTYDVMCYPEPDALNPCEDIMGSHWLRVSVWVVLVTAVIGNMAVIVVLFSNFVDVTVPKFLMCHLAFADLCMGLYLLFLASMDLHSMDFYFNYAFDWQYGLGCQVAGFLTVFASQLSIFTLTIVTLERWFAITHAIYLNRRIKLGMAAKIMAVGWVYSITMAALPLFGISNYSSTSICLPMEASEISDVAYLMTLLVMTSLAFVIIVICYAQIYLSLDTGTRCSSPSNSGTEMTVAKKMALLVFTDFACWAPIAFFSVTALAGFPLIDVTRSKILLVFFYPLNSCANPYLYAILTAQYRRDFYALFSKCGLFTKKAQQYKLAYSLPTTNNSNPIPLLLKSPGSNGNSSRKSSKTNNNINEVYV